MKHLKTPQELNKASENLNISDVRQRCLKCINSVLGRTPSENEHFLTAIDLYQYVEIVKKIADEFGENYMDEESVGSCLDLEYYFDSIKNFLDWVEEFYNVA